MEYKKLPTPEQHEEFQVVDDNWLKTTCICIGMILLGGGLAFAVVVTGISPQFLTDQDCFALQNESFINGTLVGGEYTLALITEKMIKCKKLPISYAGHNYTLVAYECLNLTK